MTILLQINTSMQETASQSSNLADKVSEKLLTKFADMRRIKRDLGKHPVPHLDHDTFQTFLDPDTAVTSAQKAGLARSDILISELKDAQILVLGVPMYNLMIPSTLKSWIDHVTRAGQTFAFTEDGPLGLLKDKKAYIVIAQGGNFLGTSDDLATAYLRSAFGFMGIVDLEFIYVQGLAMGDEARKTGLHAASQAIRALI